MSIPTRRSLRLQSRMNDLSSSQSSEESSCIDLTEEDPEYIDLTNSLRVSPISLRPVVLPLSPIEAFPGRRSRTNSRRRQSSRRRDDSSVEIISTPQPYTTNRRGSRLRGRASEPELNDSVQILPSTDVVNVIDSSQESLEVLSPPSSRISNLVNNPNIYTSPIPVKITCPICMDDDRQIKRTSRQLTSTVCGHIFCSQCIKQSLRSFHTCPTCRKSLRMNQIHPIFL